MAGGRRSSVEASLGSRKNLVGKRFVVTMRGGAGKRSVSSNAMLLLVWQPEREDGMNECGEEIDNAPRRMGASARSIGCGGWLVDIVGVVVADGSGVRSTVLRRDERVDGVRRRFPKNLLSACFSVCSLSQSFAAALSRCPPLRWSQSQYPPARSNRQDCLVGEGKRAPKSRLPAMEWAGRRGERKRSKSWEAGERRGDGGGGSG